MSTSLRPAFTRYEKGEAAEAGNCWAGAESDGTFRYDYISLSG